MLKSQFILRAVSENGDEYNVLLGTCYQKVNVTPLKTINDSLLRWLEKIRPCCYPHTTQFIITADEEVIPIVNYSSSHSGSIKVYYVVCEGKTVDTIYPKDYKDLDNEGWKALWKRLG